MPCMLLVYRYIGLDCLCLACYWYIYIYIGLGCLCLAFYWYIDILDLAAYVLHATGI